MTAKSTILFLSLLFLWIVSYLSDWIKFLDMKEIFALAVSSILLMIYISADNIIKAIKK